MRRSVSIAVAQLFAFLQVFIVVGVVNAQGMKIACVGDSITAPRNGWCSYLGMKLGSGYTAQTFGVSATTLLKDVGQPAYSTSNQFKPSQDFAPNIVVIMLGTNDSMPRNWNAGKDHFVKDYEELIDVYAGLASKPTVFLNTVPPASDDNQFSISGMIIENEINPLIKQIAMTKMVPVADVWAACDGDVTKLDSFDGVHPGDAGQMLIADAVAKAIMSPMIPGGSAGSSGSPAAGSSANASGTGGGGQAGASVNAGGAGGGAQPSANSGGAGAAATGGTGAVVPARAGTGAVTSTSGNTGSSMTTQTSPAAASGTANAAGNMGTAVNAVTAGGPAAPVMSPTDSGGGCRTVESSASTSGPTAALLLLLGLAIRSRKRTRA